MGTKRYELTDGEWNHIKDMLSTQRKESADARQNVTTAQQ